jgi:hypothetical protein
MFHPRPTNPAVNHNEKYVAAALGCDAGACGVIDANSFIYCLMATAANEPGVLDRLQANSNFSDAISQ